MVRRLSFVVFDRLLLVAWWLWAGGMVERISGQTAQRFNVDENGKRNTDKGIFPTRRRPEGSADSMIDTRNILILLFDIAVAVFVRGGV